MNEYDFKKIEARWSKKWAESDYGKALDDSKKPKHYHLIEFPYPSGAGLHVGHCMGYGASDAYCRMKRMQGFEVMFPMGWDAFGLPTENYAIKNKIKPQKATADNVANFKKQMSSLALSFDWSREINTTDPEYYKWTQWIFLQFYKHAIVNGKLIEVADDDLTTPRLAYQAEMPVNWCPSCKINLANEEVIAGKCERCGAETEKRMQKQWMLRITSYADRLISDLDKVDYEERIKTQQVNWIGRSTGSSIKFQISKSKLQINDKCQNPNYLLLHGYTKNVDKVFIPWLKKELESKGFKVQFPNLPNSNEPKESEQIEYVLKNCQIDENTIIFGHSLGAVLAMKLLLKYNKPIKGLILVAAAIDPSFLGVEPRPYWDHFSWDIDYKKIIELARCRKVISDLRESEDAKYETKRTAYLRELAPKLDATLVEVESQDEHFTNKIEPDILNSVIPDQIGNPKKDLLVDPRLRGDDGAEHIEVFTTRADTLYGATYVVLAPESDYISKLKTQISNLEEVEKYITEAKKKSDIDRADVEKEKTGVKLEGVKAINPINNEEIPIFVADYVLAGYGTGAVMAVPAHDSRDFEFAKKYDLPIREVIIPKVIDKHDPPREGVETIYRKAIQVILTNPKNDKVLCLVWKKFPWTTFITGGIEEGESVEEAAKREILEETGYKNVKYLKTLGNQVESHFYANHKGVNRKAHFNAMVFELVDESQGEMSEEEKAIHELKWVTWKELDDDKNVKCAEYDIWIDRFHNPEHSFDEYGVLVDSEGFNDLESKEAMKKITEKLKETGAGDFTVNYKLRDWIFSRQHYWGEPIPIIFCNKCGKVPVPEDQLPIVLPEVENYEPTDTGESPLAKITDWVNVKCPKCGGEAKRETDTMPNWAGSSWYFLAYASKIPQISNLKAQSSNIFKDREKEIKHWMPVDLYNGGAEHITLHLLYSRFWHKFLFDLGVVPGSEPYKKRIFRGIILGTDGRKMSKSFGNVINPDDMISEFGADTLRAYIMFIGPYDQESAWNMNGIQGVHRFIKKVWENFRKIEDTEGKEGKDDTGVSRLMLELQKTIKGIGEDIERFSMNTYIAKLMEFNNLLVKEKTIAQNIAEKFLILLSPAMPFVSEELWESIGHKDSIFKSEWPKFDQSVIDSDKLEIPIQINGKVRHRVHVSSNISDDELEKMVLVEKIVIDNLAGKEPKKIIVVSKKLVSIVV